MNKDNLVQSKPYIEPKSEVELSWCAKGLANDSFINRVNVVKFIDTISFNINLMEKEILTIKKKTIQI